jgi:hypothetical protein
MVRLHAWRVLFSVRLGTEPLAFVLASMTVPRT